MKPMPPKIKQWVEALRSGHYQQARGRLKRDAGYCCLGVLCDISKLGKWVNNNNESAYQMKNRCSWQGHLPPEVTAWAGITPKCSVTYGGDLTGLAKINDKLAKSFPQIADLIESQWEALVL